MYVIYALVDPRDNSVYYVGLTANVYQRFRDHVYGNIDNPAKSAWIQSLRDANVMVVMSSLEQVETLEQAEKRESYWIQHYYNLGAQLTNQVIPLAEEIAYVRVQDAELRLKPRMTPNEQRRYVTDLHWIGLSRKAIIDQVKGYIHPEFVNVVVSELQPCIPNLVSIKGGQKEPVKPTYAYVDDIRDLQQEGHNQDEIIEKVFKIKKGGNPKYYEARDIYRACNEVIKSRKQDEYENGTGRA